MKMEQVAAYCNQYGFIYQGSEIYGGLANTWDYGPLGTRLKNRIKDLWRYEMIQKRHNSFELDSDILMNPAVWQASGHLEHFSDPMVDCRVCKSRYRADQLIEEAVDNICADGLSPEQMGELIQNQKVTCPRCGASDFTEVRQFNLMFETKRGVTEDSAAALYLRPENAQGEYVNYHNVLRTGRAKLPFSIGQIGKAFRNEITPGNFTFRTIEFEQAELQTFCQEKDSQRLYEQFKQLGLQFFERLGINRNHLRFHNHEKLAHYAKEACDIEYQFSFGWGEINGTHNRTDFDLRQHQAHSGRNMEYFDSETGEKWIPHIIESTYGIDRIVLAILCEALTQEEERLVLRLKPQLAPVQVSVLPLIRKRHGAAAWELYERLKPYWMASYDDAGNIGRRYRRGDVVGTPFAITIDDQTAEDGSVTIRERDSMQQERISPKEINQYLKERLLTPWTGSTTIS